MTECFSRIPLKLHNLDLTRIKGEFIEQFDQSFTNYSIPDLEYLHNLIKPQIEFLIKPDLVIFTEILKEGTYPHRDTYECVLNYYVSSEQARTWFFTQQHTQTADVEQSEHSVSYRYNLKDLKVLDTFCAQDHEAYLLNTDNIHGVQKKLSDRPRQIIRWLWRKVPYKIVKNSIRIKDN